MEEWEAGPFPPGSWCRAIPGASVSKQTREHPAKLQRLEPAGPELAPHHQRAASVSFLQWHQWVTILPSPQSYVLNMDGGKMSWL